MRRDGIVKYRRYQQAIMGYVRPTSLLDAILYDMTCLDRRLHPPRRLETLRPPPLLIDDS